MSITPMHADEARIDVAQVQRLIAGQFPEWQGLPLDPVVSAGTDNAIFRLGDDLAVRLPRIEASALKVAKEYRWVPALAPHLPLEVPVPLALGAPGEGYPWQWLVTQWVEGITATEGDIEHSVESAHALAAFVNALEEIDASEGPPAVATSGRGAPLAPRDPFFRHQLAQLAGDYDIAKVAAVWEQALAAPDWDRPPVWLHGDLLPGNVLVRGGRITGVIDFGTLCVGDPAAEAAAAWALFAGEAREVYRASLPFDDDTWQRGRGWALYIGVAGLPYYRETNPVFAAVCRRMLDEVLAEAG